MKKKKVLLFTDMVLDDAIGITWLLLSQTIDIVGIIAVAGNQQPIQAEHNATKLLNVLKIIDVPIYSTKDYKQEYKLLPFIHGEDGMGDCIDNLYGLNYDIRDFKNIFNDLVSVNSFDIISLGPLTLLSKFLQDYKGNNIDEIVLMGGTLYGNGNYKKGKEFNFGFDEKSVEYVLNHTKHLIKIIPLETTSKYCLLENTYSVDDHRKIFRDLVSSYMKLAKKRDRVAIPHDLIAILAAHYPDYFKWIHASNDLEIMKNLGILTRNQKIRVAHDLNSSTHTIDKLIWEGIN